MAMTCWECDGTKDVGVYALCRACLKRRTDMSAPAIAMCSDLFGQHMQTNAQGAAA